MNPPTREIIVRPGGAQSGWAGFGTVIHGPTGLPSLPEVPPGFIITDARTVPNDLSGFVATLKSADRATDAERAMHATILERMRQTTAPDGVVARMAAEHARRVSEMNRPSDYARRSLELADAIAGISDARARSAPPPPSRTIELRVRPPAPPPAPAGYRLAAVHDGYGWRAVAPTETTTRAPKVWRIGLVNGRERMATGEEAPATASWEVMKEDFAALVRYAEERARQVLADRSATSETRLVQAERVVKACEAIRAGMDPALAAEIAAKKTPEERAQDDIVERFRHIDLD